MRPQNSSAGTLIRQSVKPFHQLTEQVALLSHVLAGSLENPQFDQGAQVALCIIPKLRMGTS
jgi:hypothetical protein